MAPDQLGSADRSECLPADLPGLPSDRRRDRPRGHRPLLRFRIVSRNVPSDKQVGFLLHFGYGSVKNYFWQGCSFLNPPKSAVSSPAKARALQNLRAEGPIVEDDMELNF